MNELGRSISRHQGTIGAGGWLWYIGAILLAAGVLNVLRGLGAIASTGGTAPPDTLSLGLVALVIAPLVILVPITRWRQSLEIFEGGYVWTRLLFGTKTVRKDEIRAVRHVTRVGRGGTRYEIEITLSNGAVQSIVGVDRSQQAVNMIAQLLRGGAPAASAPLGTGWQPPAGVA